MYLYRVLEVKLREYLDYFSVVAITGPRQSGKSTLLLELCPDYEYVSFDSQVNVTLFYDDPEKFMRIYHDRVIFDEVQKVPEIFDAIKLAVDGDRDNAGKFIVTGSRQLQLSQEISESLAGRVGKLSLLPYEYCEMPEQFHLQSVYQGAFPELVKKNYRLFDDWYASYMETYIEKDVRDLSNLGNLRDFQRLIQLLAVNASQLLNMSTYAKKLGVDVKTIKHWISVLEASYIIFLLPPYYDNLGKRAIKSPKIYFYDTGLVAHLCGILNQDVYERGPMKGEIFENYIIAECLKQLSHRKIHSKLYFYRSSDGKEIDLIIDHRSHLDFVEIKAGETFASRMTHTMEELSDENTKAYLVYNGKDYPYVDNVQVLNYQSFLRLLTNS